jgi:ubiquitin carboxyl-terminal hydrolase 47
MLNSLEAEKELYKDKGPLVYELFSINMHTGSAMGGHYYTFIKSFENGLWYTFNDIMVTKLRADELKKAFGEENPRCIFH